MTKKTKTARTLPYYVVHRVDTAEELEALLNELCEEGFTIQYVLSGYVVVALMPAL